MITDITQSLVDSVMKALNQPLKNVEVKYKVVQLL